MSPRHRSRIDSPSEQSSGNVRPVWSAPAGDGDGSSEGVGCFVGRTGTGMIVAHILLEFGGESIRHGTLGRLRRPSEDRIVTLDTFYPTGQQAGCGVESAAPGCR